MEQTHERPARRPLAVPPELVATRLEAVARELESRAAWFRARADRFRRLRVTRPCPDTHRPETTKEPKA